MLEFVKNLDCLIVQQNITRSQLLKELGLGKNSILNWETRDTLPNGKTLVLLADYFGVTIDALIGRETNVQIKNVSIDTLYTAEQENGKNHQSNE